MSANDVTFAALSEVGHPIDTPAGYANPDTAPPPSVVLKAVNLGRLSCGLEPIDLRTFVGRQKKRADVSRWLRLHGEHDLADEVAAGGAA